MRNNTHALLKVEKFFTEQLWQLIIVFASVALWSYIFDKALEAVMFCIAHFIIRNRFDKQYHCGATALCLLLTLLIAFTGILFSFDISISLVSSVILCWLVAFFGYIA